MGKRAVGITSWYPKFNGSHFGLPPSSVHKMTGLGGKFVVNDDGMRTCTGPTDHELLKVPARWAPRILTFDMKMDWREKSRENG